MTHPLVTSGANEQPSSAYKEDLAATVHRGAVLAVFTPDRDQS